MLEIATIYRSSSTIIEYKILKEAEEYTKTIVNAMMLDMSCEDAQPKVNIVQGCGSNYHFEWVSRSKSRWVMRDTIREKHTESHNTCQDAKEMEW